MSSDVAPTLLDFLLDKLYWPQADKSSELSIFEATLISKLLPIALGDAVQILSASVVLLLLRVLLEAKHFKPSSCPFSQWIL